MKKIMNGVTVLSLTGTILFGILFYYVKADIFLTLTITFGTACYHLIVRLLIAFAINAIYHNQMNCDRKWFYTSKLEQCLYHKIRVKQWKNRMPTYLPDTFRINRYTIDNVAKVMCQSEVIHELNVVFSFVPLLFSNFFGAFWVFFLTSAAAAVFDLSFVVIQRYNRPRLAAVMKEISK